MSHATRLLTPDQAIAIAQENIQGSPLITITAYLGQVEVPSCFAQVGGGGVTSKDGLHYVQWSIEKGELLILFVGLGLFTYQLEDERKPAGWRQRHGQPADDHE
ncbi:hypothetical protein SAMN00120144_3630 [Hymenobacter roseosalivarius DSM 11622]|uniref:Uncharacterized protein n=1 Tax=Hymenobacter roseosalivarius DSM 11622 TaxID=645990 RepID=A0A1W1UIW3_9BACT|nr:hypothetical protein [Hymenobacter roseosalivarius]SMB80982.1 hypothetical protein SAMN00120144_3630 [Hymenobacter roseosalivarius DSM 11622]